MTALKRVAATSATSSAQKTWTMAVAEEGEVNSVVQDVGRVTPTRTRLQADLKRASQPIVKPMTGNVQVVGSPCHRDPDSRSGPEVAGTL